MPRADLIQTNMTGGELSPQLALGRPDIAKYANGLRRAENVTITVQGGAKRRPGSLFLTATRSTTNFARLVEFIYSRDQAYVIEMGAGYLRFIRNRAQIPVEVATPYDAGKLQAVTFVQKADTAFFVHEGAYPQRLQRFGDAAWALGPAPLAPAPMEEQGAQPAAALTLGAVSGTTTATAGAAAFYPSDVGRSLQAGIGRATVVGFVSTTQVSVRTDQPFAAVALPAGTWALTDSPMAAIVPSGATKVGEMLSLSHGAASLGLAQTIDHADVVEVGYMQVFLPGHGLPDGATILLTESKNGDTAVAGLDGRHYIEVFDANTFRFVYNGTPVGLTSGKVAQIIDNPATSVWRADDVGKTVTINEGSVLITSVPSTTVANGRTLHPVTTAALAGPGAWSLNSPAWSDAKGYPRAVTINKQRLLFAGSPGYPQNLWASAIQGYLDFGFGVEADQPFRFELDGARNSPIRHLAPSRQLLVLTDSDEMTVSGGQDNSITPTNIQKTDQTTVGSTTVRPIKVGNEVLFVQPPGRRIYAAAYRFDIDGVSAVDRTVFASHITGPGIVELSHRQDTDQQLFAVRSDGVLAVCAYDVDQEVVGWSRWNTTGAYESLCTVPTSTGEDTYAVVRRLVGGQAVHYIEVFDPTMLVDCGIRGSNPAGQAVWSVPHLDGLAVVAYADGAALGPLQVTGGQVTLPRPAFDVQIGLAFTVLVEPLQVEIGTGAGTSQGKAISLCEVLLRVLDTTGCLINGVPFEFRRTDTAATLDLPPPTVTGDVRDSGMLGADLYRTTLVIEQRQPMPFHLLDIIRRVTVNA